MTVGRIQLTCHIKGNPLKFERMSTIMRVFHSIENVHSDRARSASNDVMRTVKIDWKKGCKTVEKDVVGSTAPHMTLATTGVWFKESMLWILLI